MSDPLPNTLELSQPSQTKRQDDDENIPDIKEIESQSFDTDGLALHIKFSWSHFRNTISEKNGDTLTPLYIQHFHPTEPQLRYNNAEDTIRIATGTIHSVSISGECTVNNHTIVLKPLSRLKTLYNYLSPAFAPDGSSHPVPITWTANMTMKTWDFVCLDQAQLPIAMLKLRMFSLTNVGSLTFAKTKAELSQEMIDEVVVAGTTILYIMLTRMNSPLHLVGAAFAKPGKVSAEGDGAKIK